MLTDELPCAARDDDLSVFAKDGSVVLRDALPTDLIGELRSAAIRLRERAPVRCSYRGRGKLGFRSLVWHDRSFLPLVTNPRVLPTVVALLSPNIRLLSSHLVTYDEGVGFESGGERSGGQGWHRDDVFHIEGDLGYERVPRLAVHCANYLSDVGGRGGSATAFLPESHLSDHRQCRRMRVRRRSMRSCLSWRPAPRSCSKTGPGTHPGPAASTSRGSWS